MGVLNTEMVTGLPLSAKIALLPALWTLYLIGSAVYYVFFHPLASVPGPKLYAISPIPYYYHLYQGTWVRTITRLHEQYGPAVRFAPADVSFITADAVKTIYGHGGKTFEKDLRIYRQGRPVRSIITSDHENHRRMRRQLSHAFSMKALRAQDKILNHYVDLFIAGLTKRAGTEIDMVAWYNFATFDLIGHLAMGQPFGCLEKGEYHPWVRILFAGLKATAFTQVKSPTLV
ncbi:isotrichodermin c-15 hydroxylase, partial [Fusarium langsethiae]